MVWGFMKKTFKIFYVVVSSGHVDYFKRRSSQNSPEKF